MFKRFQIWFYKKYLAFHFNKNNKWEINENFILAVSGRFNDKWLRSVGPLTLNNIKVSTHYKNYALLLNVLMDIIQFIEKEQNIVVDGLSYSAKPETKNLIDYLTSNQKLNDVYLFQIELKNKTNRLVYLLETSKKTSEIQYGYYRRNCDKLFSDILDLYSSFLEIAEQR